MSLDDTVQDVADRLGVPLVVLDLDLKVAAYSIHDTGPRRARLAGLLAESATPLTESLVKEHRLRTAAHPVRILPDAESAPLVVLPLRHENRLLGYIYYLDDRDDRADRETSDADDMRLLESAGPELGMLLALRLSDLRRGAGRSTELLSALLGDSATARGESAQALLREGLIEDVEHYSVLLYRTPDPHPRSLTRLAVEATLEFTTRSTTVKIVGGVLGGDGVVLFPRPVNRARLDRVLARPGLEPVSAGVGSAKSALPDAVDSYREAQIAYRASAADPRRYGRRVFWEDLGLDRLLLELPFDRLTPDQLPVGVQRLLASPQGVELADTLEGYLDSGGEIQRTARRLNIHRSTLYHRLDRIREITGCDIADGSTRLDLHAGLRIARLAGLWPRE
ncbi:PucR family transcriptional regulator [Actinomadura sp. 3N508]|uniref:PucR family transcriptional regulator n=1 Tax=Actinomadura sp. 3N508 TaxID=3375153 RepID=UPI0037B23DC0